MPRRVPETCPSCGRGAARSARGLVYCPNCRAMLTPAGWTYDPIEAERIMPTPKLNRGDYVHCEACDVIVPKSKLVEETDFFTSKAETKCPYCGGAKLAPLDEPAA